MGWMRDRDVGTLVADTVPRALTVRSTRVASVYPVTL